MSHGPCAPSRSPLSPLTINPDLHAVINAAGTMNATTSVIIRPILVFIIDRELFHPRDFGKTSKGCPASSGSIPPPLPSGNEHSRCSNRRRPPVPTAVHRLNRQQHQRC